MATSKPKPEKSVTEKHPLACREGGRPAFEPTDAERKQVEAACPAYGLPIEQIAVLVRDGIDTDTLRKPSRRRLISRARPRPTDRSARPCSRKSPGRRHGRGDLVVEDPDAAEGGAAARDPPWRRRCAD